jgi:radical SAM protein with 4Fe4S-binding SPASM domain
MSKNFQIYIKTTETCQLDCKHCFTSGSNGKKIFFDWERTADFVYRFQKETQAEALNFVFHGGEPMLAPLKDMVKFYDALLPLPGQVTFGMQSNLVYKLTDEKKDFITGLNGFGSSWDYDIRFERGSQRRLWEENSRTLAPLIDMTMVVCMSKRLLQELQPQTVIQYAIDHGYKYILFERITHDGNALSNSDIIPSNALIDSWLYEMYRQTIAQNFHKQIGNMLLNEVATSFVKRCHIGNRCRDCEQKLLTINADGTIAGCPNSAPNDAWGHIDEDIKTLLGSKPRIDAIVKEMQRNPICLTCPVADVCNGDCYKLSWENDMCAAPKTLMKHLKLDGSHLKELIL